MPAALKALGRCESGILTPSGDVYWGTDCLCNDAFINESIVGPSYSNSSLFSSGSTLYCALLSYHLYLHMDLPITIMFTY